MQKLTWVGVAGLLIACGGEGSASKQSGEGGTGGVSGGAGTGGAGEPLAVPTSCDAPLTTAYGFVDEHLDEASFRYYGRDACALDSGRVGPGPFYVWRSHGSAGGTQETSLYGATVIAGWEWVEFSGPGAEIAQLRGDQNEGLSFLISDEDINVTLRNPSEVLEVELVFRVSRSDVNVLSVTPKD